MVWTPRLTVTQELGTATVRPCAGPPMRWYPAGVPPGGRAEPSGTVLGLAGALALAGALVVGALAGWDVDDAELPHALTSAASPMAATAADRTEPFTGSPIVIGVSSKC